MIQTILPTIPPEVQAFADERGVTTVLSSVLALTQRVFPQASRITTVVELDPGIENEYYVVIDVFGVPLTGPEFLATDRQWHEGVRALCSGSMLGLFHLSTHERP